MTAGGEFDVKLTAQPSPEKSLGRLPIDKQFRGGLTGSSKGGMLSAGGNVKGSAGYVAIEKFSGALHDRSGGFALQHSGAMNRSEAQLPVTVVPDSSTDELQGIKGRMTIRITGGKHLYEFEYSIDE